MDEITVASSEQATGIEQVNRAIYEMDGIVQQNADCADGAASASAAMETQAERMNVVVKDLMVLAGTGGNGKARSSSQAVRGLARTGAAKKIACLS